MEKIPIRHINAGPKEPAFSEGFSIRDIRELLAGQDMVEKLHRHEFFYLLVLKKGAGIHEIDFTPYKVCDDAVFFMRPGQVHRLTLKAGSTGYLVQFRVDFYHPLDKASSQVLRKASNMNFYRSDTAGLKKLLSILTYISGEYTDKQERYREAIKASLGILFIELVRQHDKSFRDNVSLYTQERLEEFLDLLETHISDHKQVSQYAGLMNLSPYQLNAVTGSALGKTPSELINEYIVLESKRHLLGTSGQVKEIAYHMGYEDPSYFIRFFRKHTGYSPEAFRHNFR